VSFRPPARPIRVARMTEVDATKTTKTTQPPIAPLVVRGGVAGILMGLANLVPGISGGTMLVAAGVYRGFIQAVAEVTTFRFRTRSLFLLGAIVGGAGLVVLLLAGPVSYLVGSYRWVMYSLFIGLTLGGVPLVWRMARPATPSLYVGCAVGFGLMAWMAFAGPQAGGQDSSLLLFTAGVAGASAMILPGVSGAYLLLLLGQYEVILDAISQLKAGLTSGGSFPVGVLAVLFPVGLGVLVGVIGVSNLLRWMLRRFEKPTLGVLLGLLLGSVLGIWPFQDPEAATFFVPGALQAVAALALAATGLGLTLLIDRLGKG
jgi:putative membrane protein